MSSSTKSSTPFAFFRERAVGKPNGQHGNLDDRLPTSTEHDRVGPALDVHKAGIALRVAREFDRINSPGVTDPSTTGDLSTEDLGTGDLGTGNTVTATLRNIGLFNVPRPQLGASSSDCENALEDDPTLKRRLGRSFS